MASEFHYQNLYSTTAGNKPALGDLLRGEIALNIADKLMFIRVGSGEEGSDTLQEIQLTPYAVEQLSNVLIETAAENQALVYGSDGKWHNIALDSSKISDFAEKVKEITGVTDGVGLVHTTGDESIDGLKTFIKTPISTAAQDITTAGATELTKVEVVKKQTIYTDNNANGATIAIGGIAKGKKYENANVVDIINDLLHPYVAPSGIGLTLSGTNGGIFEMGTTQSVTGATIRWTAGSQNVTKVELLKAGSPVAEAPVASGTSQAVTYTEEVTANASFSARVTDATKTTNGGSVNFTFVYPFYQGVVASGAALDQTAIKGLNKVVQAKGNKTYSYTTEGAQQVVFAYPASYGVLKSILDPNNFECLDTFTKTEVQITGLDSTAQNYYVYAVTTNIQAFAYQFKF